MTHLDKPKSSFLKSKEAFVKTNAFFNSIGSLQTTSIGQATFQKANGYSTTPIGHFPT